MYISEIKIERFGPIGQLHFQFSDSGINIIEGGNGAGKTQLLAAVYAMFYGDEVINYSHCPGSTGTVSLQIALPGGKATLESKYSDGSSVICAGSFEQMVKAARVNRDELFFYFPHAFDREKKVYSKDMIRRSYKFLCGLGLQSHHILGTCLAKTEMNVVMSVGEARYLELMYILSQLPENSVFFGDSIFSAFDSAMQGAILAVLERMAGHQFILTENSHITGKPPFLNIKSFKMPKQTELHSPASYNYKTIYTRVPQREAADGLIIPVVFCVGSEFPYEECEHIEFKELKGNNPCASIIANAEIYINAYLNSALNETGKIFWGVADDRRITGVPLSYQDKDTIQKRIAEALSKAQPYISPDIYYIKFHQVSSQEGRLICDTYIVEIGIAPYHSSRLFSTAKGEVYIKTAGGKEKLTPLQIQEQILLRIKQG